MTLQTDIAEDQQSVADAQADLSAANAKLAADQAALAAVQPMLDLWAQVEAIAHAVSGSTESQLMNIVVQAHTLLNA